MLKDPMWQSLGVTFEWPGIGHTGNAWKYIFWWARNLVPATAQIDLVVAISARRKNFNEQKVRKLLETYRHEFLKRELNEEVFWLPWS